MEEQNTNKQTQKRPLLITIACLFNILGYILGIGLFTFFAGAGGQSEITTTLILISLVVVSFITTYLIWQMKRIGAMLYILISLISLIIALLIKLPSNFFSLPSILTIIAIIIYYKEMK